MEFLVEGLRAVTWQQVVMYLVGFVLIYLAIKKEYEPSLLLPMGFGAILVNLPFSGVLDQTLQGGIQSNGIIQWLFHTGIEASEAMPILLFIGIGAMIDFGPLLTNPLMFLFGAGAQFGIFAAILLAAALGFDLKDAVSIGIIGAADGPTSLLVSQVLGSRYIGAIAVAAYSYMALVPIVQPFAIRLVTTKKERQIHMEYHPGSVTKTMRILFPIIVTMVVGFVSPQSVALIGFLMFGNLIRECGVLHTMSETAQNTLANLITVLLGITVSFSMRAEAFVTVDTLMILAIGLFAFVNGHDRRRASGEIHESFPEKEDQPHDWRIRNFRVPDVLPGHPEDGDGGGPDQCHSDACGRSQRFRADRFRHRGRSGHQSGKSFLIKKEVFI